MSAYETIFYGMPYVSCILAGVGMLSLALQKRAILARSILFSFQFWIAPLFYFIYMAMLQRPSTLAVTAGCLELLFLVIYQILFRRLFVAVTSISHEGLPKMLTCLKVGTWIIIALTVLLYFQSGAGIFSEGSRNEFLVGSRLNLYLEYAVGLVQVVMAPVVAVIVNVERRWRGSVVFYLVLISATSVLSASKGGAILTLLAIVSLLEFERARDFLRVLLVPICGAAMALSITVYFVGNFLSLEPSEMVSLMFSRLFLANDCRALAIDWSGHLGDNGTSVFRESFRLYAALIGNAPKFPPLGQLLYALQHGTVGMVGANTSSTALLIVYGSDIGKSFFILLLAATSLGIGLLADIPGRWDVPRLAIGISLLSLLSQDFLAFQVCFNILVLLFVAVLTKKMLAGILRLSLPPNGNGTRPPMILPR